jgi:hypothetical protein
MARARAWLATSDWRFARAVARVAPVEHILAEYATAVCGLPVRRRETHDPGLGLVLGRVTWSIDDEVMVELVPSAEGPHLLRVHDLSLLGPIRKALRTRHVRVEYASLA